MSDKWPIEPSSSSPSEESDQSSSHPFPSPRNKRKGAQPFKSIGIRSDQWTPISGVPVIKQRRPLHPNPLARPSDTPQTDNQSGRSKLVPLLGLSGAHSPSPSSDVEDDDDPTLVSTERKVSLYVECFEEALETVVEHENHLFTQSELNLICSWKSLKYPARYLFVRMFMRKKPTDWFRIDDLRKKYGTETEDVLQACISLCEPINNLQLPFPSIQQNVLELNAHPGPSTTLPASDTITEPSASTCAANYPPQSPLSASMDSDKIPPELLQSWCVSVGRLNVSLDQALKENGMEPWMIPNSGHDFPRPPHLPPISQPVPASSQNMERAPSMPPSPPNSPPALNQLDTEFDSFASMTTQPCVSLNTDDLFSCMRLDDIKSLARKMHLNPHSTREVLIEALKTTTKNQATLCGGVLKGKEKKILSLRYDRKGLKNSQASELNSHILNMIGPCIKLCPAVCGLFRRLHIVFYRLSIWSEQPMLASILAKIKIRQYPSYPVMRTRSIFESRSALMDYERALEKQAKFDALLDSPLSVSKRHFLQSKQDKEKSRELKESRAQEALQMFEAVWVEWKRCVAEETKHLHQVALAFSARGPSADHDFEQHDRLTYYKNRFRPGWPLTRILCKATELLARKRDFLCEIQVLEALLDQHFFRRGKRGIWYDRLALLLMKSLSESNVPSPASTCNLTLALHTCQAGLADPHTHEAERLNLINRLRKLLNRAPPDLLPPGLDMPITDEIVTRKKITIVRTRADYDHEIGRKSSWFSPLDGSVMTVEEISLEHYASEGWSGYHSESGILTMIFSLIFWDVIFAPIEGAFETPFQNAPLDFDTDAFAIARAPLFEHILQNMNARGIDEALERMTETYERESSRHTWCIGVNWDKYGLQELCEITECLGVRAISVICLEFFRDWRRWSSGVPDLCLWNHSQKKCRFVEVKGPGDQLSSKQKAWVKLLTNSTGVEVEICAVQDS